MKVELIDHMGSDLSVVNAARVSFDGAGAEYETYDITYGDAGYSGPRQSEVLTQATRLSAKDKGLIRFLARGCTSGDWDRLLDEIQLCSMSEELGNLRKMVTYLKRMPAHWSPFAHTAVTLRFEMPIFVARQIMKHTTGIEYNEVSRRYVIGGLKFYFPEEWRSAADNVKQGSGGPADSYTQNLMNRMYEDLVNHSKWVYDRAIAHGIAAEQVRMVLPQSMMTKVIVTGNLYALANMYVQRSDGHAQKEAQMIAEGVKKCVQPLFPVSWEALTGNT